MLDTPQTTQTPGVDRRAVRILARTMFQQAWGEANPDAPREERKAAWTEARAGEMKKARTLLRKMGKAGLVVSVAEGAADEAPEDDDAAV